MEIFLVTAPMERETKHERTVFGAKRNPPDRRYPQNANDSRVRDSRAIRHPIVGTELVQQGARKAVIRLDPGLCKAPGADFEGSIPAAEMSGFVPLQECWVGAISLN